MGTKRLLAAQIAAAAEGLQHGPFMDLFSGISAAGAAVAAKRNVWCNDAQAFSTLLTKALYTSASELNSEGLRKAIRGDYEDNHLSLTAAVREELRIEDACLAAPDRAAQIARLSEVSASARVKATPLRGAGKFSLLLTTHSGTYFGIRQCIEMDSIRAGADRALSKGAISSEQHRWAILALCRAASATSNSTGHFAQALTPKPDNISRVISKRRRSPLAEWSCAIDEMNPVGTPAWRKGNKVFQKDAISLAKELSSNRVHPGILYADPPYTDDQYSRYYHLLENIVLYDYPDTYGKGEYRPDRFVSKFSLANGVRQAFDELIEAASRTNSAFMLSYPSNGLLKNSPEFIGEKLRKNFETVHDPLAIAHEHSTMGASKGAQKHQVTEYIYVAEGGRHSERRSRTMHRTKEPAIG